MSWFKRKAPSNDLDFVDVSRRVYQHFPIQRAADVPTIARETQIASHGKYLFPHCPGMIDYARMGYIIPAWVDIRIKANKAGVVTSIGSVSRGDRGFRRPEPMSSDIVSGFFTPEDGVPLRATKVESPWYLFAKENISAILAPPIYHTDWGDDLHTWVGCVDYQKCPVTNFIFSPKRECEVHIKAGEPLLHVIPFFNKEVSAGCGAGTQEQVDATNNITYTDDSQFYRKFMAVKKIFSLSGGKDT